MAKTLPQIVITIKGGMIQYIQCDKEYEIVVLDFDNPGVDKISHYEIDDILTRQGLNEIVKNEQSKIELDSNENEDE